MSKKIIKKLSVKKNYMKLSYFQESLDSKHFLKNFIGINTSFISRYPKLKPTKTIKFSSYNTEGVRHFPPNNISSRKIQFFKNNVLLESTLIF